MRWTDGQRRTRRKLCPTQETIKLTKIEERKKKTIKKIANKIIRISKPLSVMALNVNELTSLI